MSGENRGTALLRKLKVRDYYISVLRFQENLVVIIQGVKCEKTVDLSCFNRSLHHTNMQESYVNIASMQTSLESIQTHAE